METALLLFVMLLVGLAHLVAFLTPFVAIGAWFYALSRVL